MSDVGILTNFLTFIEMENVMNSAMRRITDSVSAAYADKRVIVKDGNDAISVASIMQRADKAGALSSMYDKYAQATLLNNFIRKVSDSIDAPATHGQQVNMMSDFGPYVPEILPIISAWYPDFPLKDLISVQPISQDLAYVFYSKLVTGTNKAPTIVGQVVETANGPRQINGYYPTGEIFGETIPADQIEEDGAGIVAVTAYYALNTTGDYLEKYKIVAMNGNEEVAVYFASGVAGGRVNLINEADASDNAAYMDIESGAIVLPKVALADIDSLNVNYVWNLDYAIQENIPKVKEQIDKIELRAQPRALSMTWTVFAEALRKSQFKKSIREENARRVMNLLYQYQVRYILDDMWTYSRGGWGQININQNMTMSLDVLASNVSRQLKAYATQIEVTTGMVEGNRLVVGKDLKAFFESLPTNWFQPVKYNSPWSTAREIGTFAGFKVYYDPWRGDDEALMSWKNSEEWWAAPYILAPYMPIVPTDTVNIGVLNTQAICSMEAYKFMHPTSVIKLKVRYI